MVREPMPNQNNQVRTMFGVTRYDVNVARVMVSSTLAARCAAATYSAGSRGWTVVNV